MCATVSSTIDRLRQPAYTGENRCTPCTVVNVGIAAVVAAVVGAALWSLGPSIAVAAAIVALGLELGAIYLRGYLVPGTPSLTKRYFPDWVLARFDKLEEPRSATDEAFDVERTLVDGGVLVECEDVDDLCLAEGVRDRWDDRIRSVREGDSTRENLAEVLDVDADALDFDDHGDAFLAYYDGRRVGQWESRAAFVADMAAARELAPRLDIWTALEVRERSALLDGLRLFLERCPACDGPVAMGEETVESCCRSFDVVAVSCEDCGARLFEAQMPGA